MKTILVPVDFSAVTTAVVRAACGLARHVGGKLVLLHVVQPPVVIDVYGLGHDVLAETMAASEQITTRKLHALCQQCARAQVTARALQQGGKPVREIVNAARRLKPAYLVIGTHGHGAAYDILVGSTTHGVLRQVACPVLVIPPRRRRR